MVELLVQGNSFPIAVAHQQGRLGGGYPFWAVQIMIGIEVSKVQMGMAGFAGKTAPPSGRWKKEVHQSATDKE